MNIEWATLGTFLDIICYVQFSRCSQSTNRQETLPIKPQWKDIGILPADSIHTIRRKFVSNRIYEVACLVQVAINVLRYSPCCYIVLTVTLTFSPSVHVVYRFPMPQGLYCAEEVQDRKGLSRSCQNKRMEEEKAWEDTWNRVAEFPNTFLFPQVLWSWVYIVTTSLNQ